MNVRAGAALVLFALLGGGCAPRVEPRPAPPVDAQPAPRVDAQPADGASAPEPYERAWPVMGTMLRVVVWDTSGTRAAHVAATVRAVVSELDSLLSNYRDDSDVSRVNRSTEWQDVAPLTTEALASALDYARRSGGAFDPTVGPMVDVWGFYRETGAMPPPAAIDSARALVGWQRVEMTRVPSRARLPVAGMRLDFGAIGKGFAVERALAAAEAAGATTLMVDLGGNIGVLGAAPGGGDWPLGLRHPRDPDVPFAVIDAPAGSAVATSGDYERFFVHDGVRYAHIVDPRTGWPVQGVASVSVLAPGGTASDALSTSLFVLGVEAGCRFVEDEPGVAAIWVLPPASDDGVLHAVVGGPEAERIAVAPDVVLSRCEEMGR